MDGLFKSGRFNRLTTNKKWRARIKYFDWVNKVHGRCITEEGEEDEEEGGLTRQQSSLILSFLSQ